MVSLPPCASPTLVSSSLPADAPFAAFGRARGPHSSLTSPGPSSPSSSLPSSPSPRFPCMDPVPGPAYPSHQFTKSSIPSPPEHYSMQVKPSLDHQPILPMKPALAKHSQEHDGYFERQDRYRRDHNASSAHSDNKQSSRMEIATLLCADAANNSRDSSHHRQEPEPSHRRFDDDQDVPSHSYTNANGSYPSHPSHEYSPRNGSSRDAHAPRDMDTTSSPPMTYRGPQSDRYTHSNVGSRAASFSASSAPSYSTSSSPNSSSFSSSAPRSLHPGAQHRSASWNTDRYQDYNHSYDEQRRNDRSKNDPLHQQNYGPYLNASPPPGHAAVHHKNHSAEPSSASYPRIPPTDSSAPLYYPAPASSTSSSSTSTSSSYPYPSSSNSSNISHGSRPSAAARSIHDYGHAPNGETSSGDQLRRQSHGPLLPPPSALLCPPENKPPRVYGRDSTVDDNWPPLPRATRVVPIDAPNENRPFSLPALPYPSSSSSSKAPPSSSSSSSAHRPYPSSYNASSEPKPRRVYGIDAADVPLRMPPPAPSSHFGNGQYSKPLQHIPDDEEGEDVRRRSIAQESGSYSRHYGNGSSYGPQAHGYSSSSHRYQSEAEPPRYDYDNRGWKSSQPPSRPQSPPMHAPSSTSSSSASRPPYSSSQPYSRPQSPEIQPPSWYQHYAHSVTPKGHSDSHYYGHSHHHGSNGNYSSNGYHGAEAMDDEYGHQGDGARLSSKRSKSALNDGQSVHPFDTPELKSSKSKKPKRIKNPGHDEDLILLDNEVYAVKAKRKRANASQLSVLNAAFERSYFPSTEERLRLSKQCRMCPRTVQIWFQNKRQSVKAKSEAMEAAAAVAEGRRASASAVVSSEKVEGGQKRTVDGESDRRRSSGGPGSSSAEAIITALDIQLDGRSVDYFSRKRRATIAKMEQNEQKQRQKQDQIQEEDLSELPSEPQSPSQE